MVRSRPFFTLSQSARVVLLASLSQEMSFFVLPPFSFKTPRGGRVTVFGALLTIPLVLGVNEYLDHRKGKAKEKKETSSKKAT